MSYILKGLCDEEWGNSEEIFRSVNRLSDEELYPICAEYAKYCVGYEPDRKGFVVTDFEKCGDKYKIVFNSAQYEDGNYEYEGVELFFAYDEVSDKVGWLIDLKKEN